jgi:hypothetical protein
LTRTIVSATSDPMRDGLGAARVAARLTAAARLSLRARRCDAGGGEELLVIEGDDLRAPLGLEVALKIGRHVDRANGLARSNRPRRRRKVAGALDDAQPGRRRHLFHEGARGVGSVRVDDDHAEPADHRMAEDRGQHGEGEQRHAEDQDQRRTVVQQPAPFARSDQQETGFGRTPHWRVAQSI